MNRLLYFITLPLLWFPSVFAYRGISERRSQRSLASDFQSDISKSIQLAQDSLELIYYRYQMDEVIGQVFRRFLFNMDENSYDLIKYQLAKKIVGENSVYLATFGGSSVTAGHDNKFDQSYPIVFERRISEAMEAVGIQVSVHNIAQGANNCYPSNACYESMGGSDPDFINWEQSFNCGHSPDMFELAARFALWSKSPGLVYYSQSGSMGGSNKCNASKFNPPYSREAWTPASAGKPPMKATQDDIVSLKNELFRSYKELGPSSSRFGGAALEYKKEGAPLAVSGISLWDNRKMKECEGLPDGLIAGKCDLGPFFSCKGMLMFQELEASEYGNGKGASHHPTMAGHILRGELIAYVILLPFLDALYEVQADVKGGLFDRQKLFAKYQMKHESLYKLKSMPKPKYCPSNTEKEKDGSDPWHTCETKPLCFTDYHPHYSSNMSLTELVVGDTKWEYNQIGYDHWKFPDVDHLELRPGFAATKGKESGEIHFKINVGALGRVTIVGYHYSNIAYANEYLIELNVPDERMKRYQPDPEKWLVWVDIQNKLREQLSLLTNIPPGQHVLSIRTKENEKKAHAAISHIMMNADP